MGLEWQGFSMRVRSHAVCHVITGFIFLLYLLPKSMDQWCRESFKWEDTSHRLVISKCHFLYYHSGFGKVCRVVFGIDFQLWHLILYTSVYLQQRMRQESLPLSDVERLQHNCLHPESLPWWASYRKLRVSIVLHYLSTDMCEILEFELPKRHQNGLFQSNKKLFSDPVHP